MSAPGGVRVLGGELRGRVLRVPVGARPSGGRLREALFSIWQERVAGASVLDLFAGSGAVALEALSRGAAEAVVVDVSSAAIAALRRNLEALDLTGRCEIVRIDLEEEPEKLETRLCRRFDLVFADPPYGFAGWERLLCVAARLVKEDGEVAVEHSGRSALSDRFGTLRRRTRRDYGESVLSFFGLEAPIDPRERADGESARG